MKNYKVLVVSEITGQILKEFNNLTHDEAKALVAKNTNDFEDWKIIKIEPRWFIKD